MKTLIVGLDNHGGEDPRRALWPMPEGSPGDRLRQLIEEHLGKDYGPGEFVLDFGRTYLYPTSRAAAGKGMQRRDKDAFGAVLFFATELGITDMVLLGIRLRDVFNKIYRQRIDYLEAGLIEDPLMRVWSLPHPSGNNYWYNDVDNCAQAGKLLASLRERKMIPRKESKRVLQEV